MKTETLSIFIKVILLQTMSRDTKLEDDKGLLMPAVKVFSDVIKYLKNHMLTMMTERQIDQDVPEDEVYWVLTVPAIWSDAAKQFMREAAEKVGI